MNIQFAIKDGINILKDKRINTAKLDAEILMAKALKKDRKYIYKRPWKCSVGVKYQRVRQSK